MTRKDMRSGEYRHKEADQGTKGKIFTDDKQGSWHAAGTLPGLFE